jgi:zinc protease
MGGGFSSRLIQSIRTKLGLAYSVGGGVGSAYDHPGLAALAMGTKSETTVKSVAALNAELDKMQRDPITPAELKRGKDAILNSFIFEFDSKDKVLSERMTYEFYGYPADFLERYRAGVEKVTTADVERVARKYLHKDQMKVLVVGNQGEFDKPLSSLGPVTPIDIRIPGAPSEVGAVSSPR